jgi:hypothetical protein
MSYVFFIQQTSNFSFDTSSPTKKLMTGTSDDSIKKTGSALLEENALVERRDDIPTTSH